jgi:hypothetical protein
MHVGNREKSKDAQVRGGHNEKGETGRTVSLTRGLSRLSILRLPETRLPQKGLGVSSSNKRS